MIRHERVGDVALVTIDRPERRNAVDAEHCAALRSAVVTAVVDGARAIVITGASGHFCAGADLGGGRDDGFRDELRGALDAIESAPVAVIAAVDGFALGAGTQLAVAADLRVATSAARFGIPAARLGLAVDTWTVRRVAALVGTGPAASILLAAEQLGGDDSARLGFFQLVGGVDEAMTWAAEVAALAPLTIAAHKAALRGAPDAEVDAAIAAAWDSADALEGATAFAERRPPRFEGR